MLFSIDCIGLNLFSMFDYHDTDKGPPDKFVVFPNNLVLTSLLLVMIQDFGQWSSKR